MLNKVQVKETESIVEINEVDVITELSQFKASESITLSRSSNEIGVISVVNAKTGKRITLSKELMEELNNPEKVVISFNNNQIAIGRYLPNNNNYLNLKQTKTKGIIYSAGIVSEITHKYNLDFSDRTSITLYDVEYVQYEGNVVAIITIDSNEE